MNDSERHIESQMARIHGEHAAAPMHFKRYQPRSLSGLVPVIWEQESSQPLRWRILPSGWVELIFRLGPEFSLQKARLLQTESDPIHQFCFLSGLHTRPLDMVFDRFHVFGVRMHPVAVRTYFGIPCSEVRDDAVEGDLLLDDLARIEDHLRSAPDFRTRARWMERELSARLRSSRRMDTARQMWRLATLLPVSGPTPARKLRSRLGYSRSHTHRLFDEWFGQSTTDANRLARFVRAVHALQDDDVSLTEVGYRLGYFDQSHFIRDFRKFSGMTPGEYRRRKGPVPEQLPL